MMNLNYVQKPAKYNYVTQIIKFSLYNLKLMKGAFSTFIDLTILTKYLLIIVYVISNLSDRKIYG